MKKIFLLLFGLSMQNLSFSQAGMVDSTFGTSGIWTFHPNFFRDKAEDVTRDSEGRILALVAASSFYENYILRFLQDGTPDSTFGVNGILQIFPLDEGSATTINVDADDRILVSAEVEGYFDLTTYLYRFEPDGSSDISFGNNGQVKTKIAYGNKKILLQSDGKIVIEGVSDNDTPRLQRFKEDGSIDSTFNVKGYVTFNGFTTGIVNSVDEDSDHKLVITGAKYENGDLLLFRLNPDGSADESFGISGTVILENGAGQDVSVMPDGKILVTGSSTSFPNTSFVCWRFDSGGTLDNSFGTNGILSLFTNSFQSSGQFILRNDDNTYVIGGTIFNGVTNDPVVYKLLVDGSIDPNFGVNGIGGASFTTGEFTEVNGVWTSDGKIIINGTKLDNGNNLAAVSQLFSDGNIDSSFGTNGTSVVQTDTSSFSWGHVNDFAVLPDYKIFCAGQAGVPNYDMALFRLADQGISDSTYGVSGLLVPNSQQESYRDFVASGTNEVYVVENFYPLTYPFASDLPLFKVHKFDIEGKPDSSFGIFGTLQVYFPGDTLGQSNSIAVQSDGKLLIAGDVRSSITPSTSSAFLIRLNQDGSTDETFGIGGIIIFDWDDHDFNPLVGYRTDGKIIFESTYLFDTLRVVRLLSDGSFDLTFGINGIADIAITALNNGSKLLIDADNNVLNYLKDYSGYVHILRLNEAGVVDGSFGDNGMAFLDLKALSIDETPCDIQADGKILVVGFKYDGNLYFNAITRLNNDGVIDYTFGTNGMISSDAVPLIGITSIHQQPDGKILIGGGDDIDFGMERLLNDVATSSPYSESLSHLEVYPNPTSNQLIINYAFSSSEEATIIISDVTGKILREEKVNSSSDHYLMKVSDLSPGIYLLTLQTESNSVSAKFVKE